MTSENGREIISNRWKAAFITEAIEKGIKDRKPLDPFITVDPLIHDEPEISEESFGTKKIMLTLPHDWITKVVTMKTGSLKESQ